MTTDLIICTALQQLREFSAEEVGSLTNQYSEMLGRGSFGIVYKGEVGHTRVAVKVIDPVSASFNNDCGASFNNDCGATKRSESTERYRARDFCGRVGCAHKVHLY